MAYPTGDLPISSALVGFRLFVPDHIWFIQVLQGAIAALITPDAFVQEGTITTQEAAEIFEDIVFPSFLPYPDDIGSVRAYATEFAPYGTLPCDGSTHLRIDYPRLYANLDPVFIVDADTFVTPNLPGRTIVGSGSGSGLTPRAIGDVFGEEQISLTIGQIPPHDHVYTPPAPSVQLEGAGVPLPTAVQLGTPTVTGTTGEGEAHDNSQPSLTLNFFMVAI